MEQEEYQLAPYNHKLVSLIRKRDALKMAKKQDDSLVKKIEREMQAARDVKARRLRA